MNNPATAEDGEQNSACCFDQAMPIITTQYKIQLRPLIVYIGGHAGTICPGNNICIIIFHKPIETPEPNSGKQYINVSHEIYVLKKKIEAAFFERAKVKVE